MKFQSNYILFSLIILFSCKTNQNLPYTAAKKGKEVNLTGATAPNVLFVLESKDTLKFGIRDFSALLDNQIKRQIKSQCYLSDQSWLDFTDNFKNLNRDTLVFQNLSAINSKTLNGILDTWVARELLLKGKSVIALKNQTDNPKKLRYIFIKDNLGGHQGIFYTEDGKKVYSTLIALGE